VLEPLADSAFANHPVWTVMAVVAAAAVIALGIWLWPELRRTIRIHRM